MNISSYWYIMLQCVKLGMGQLGQDKTCTLRSMNYLAAYCRV